MLHFIAPPMMCSLYAIICSMLICIPSCVLCSYNCTIVYNFLAFYNAICDHLLCTITVMIYFVCISWLQYIFTCLQSDSSIVILIKWNIFFGHVLPVVLVYRYNNALVESHRKKHLLSMFLLYYHLCCVPVVPSFVLCTCCTIIYVVYLLYYHLCCVPVVLSFVLCTCCAIICVV